MWCYNDKSCFDNTNQGQITPGGQVGQTIMRYVKNNILDNIIDVGTWNGLGSSQCFLLALQGNMHTQFISLEINKDKQYIATENLKELLPNTNSQLLWGSILKKEEITNMDEIFPEFSTNSEFQRWHSIDVYNIENSPYVLDKIPEKIDFILFDGGEFTTYYEFIKLFPRCINYIALDDVHECKCRRIRYFLQTHPEWKEVEYINERNGFSLFMHK